MTDIAGQTVPTTTGRITGSREGHALCFRGIPYAASPIGALRFMAPQPHPGWAGVRETVHAGPAAPQGPSRLELVMGHRTPDWNEDGCLTLNVFRPAEPHAEQAPRPVLVWFHGGGFTSGSGGWDWYDGSRLAVLGDVVVVTANYRVGPLGYLYLPEIGADNLGCQDQRAVLRWVSENIAAFGGDAGTITVGGQSAGAFSALALALDEHTAGLVGKVLLQSGPWGLAPQDPQDAAANAEAYTRLLGLPSGPEAGEALRTLPVERLLSAYAQLAVQQARPGTVAPPMYPVLGGAGMSRPWQQGLADGALDGKPLLIGTTQDEATAFFGFDPRTQNLTAARAVQILAAVVGDQAEQLYQRHALQLPGATPTEIFSAIQTAVLFRSGALVIAGHHAAGGNATYVYQFDRRPAADPHHLGATHCGELPFLFGTFDSYPNSPMLGDTGNADRELGRNFATAVAEFATVAEVTGWAPYATGQIQHLG